MINKHIKEKCPVCDSQDYKYKKKHQGLDLGYCESCSLAYARPLIRGESDDVGDSNSTITEADFYEGLKKNHTLQSQIAIKKAPIMLEYWQRILAESCPYWKLVVEQDNIMMHGKTLMCIGQVLK